MSKHLIVMAGGTGGHVYPGLAVARAMVERGWTVSWMGTPGGMEQRLVDSSEFPLKSIAFEGIVGRGIGAKVRLPLSLLKAYAEAKRHLVLVKPTAVIGMGGYPTVPGGLAAWRAGVPLLIHQGDAVAGLANRLLAKVATTVLTGFTSTFVDLGSRRVVSGNPIRKEFADIAPATSRFAARQGRLKVLIMGGSRGAEALNNKLPEAFAAIDPAKRPHIIHQAGSGAAAATDARYKALGIQADVREFVDQSWSALAEADLFIGRSGASIVSELALLGVPSILVPYPHHADQQQLHNARTLSEVGAARIVEQRDLSATGLAALIDSIDRPTLQSMSAAATRVAQPNATQRICDAIERATTNLSSSSRP
ncbi:MAG: undecaprenyldiphospho-muramoylpentapeptide beta-N-acetylglucosaminyltransferase [Betaproteobacteria bacterium]|nr:MAG: undecaprenyldiphospho-muramoylpentapeptide beta-N-acetylglucosaminyltransferase [Betaproteobacteria bacterium]